MRSRSSTRRWIATATLLEAGRTVAVAEAKLHSASGKLLAAGMASFIVPPAGGSS